MADGLRVCMVNTSATRGGAAKMAATLTAALNSSDLGIRATLYHCDNNQIANDTVGLRRPFSRQINATLARLCGDKLICDFGIARQLTDLARDFDVVHLHNLHGYYLNYQRLLEGLRGKPIVWTWHDMWPITGRCGTTFGCECWRQGCNPCPHLDYYPAAWIDWARSAFETRTSTVVNHAGLSIVAPSQWLADLGIARGFRSDQITVIANPIDVSRFRPLPKAEARRLLGLATDIPLLLFVASDCSNPCKGYRDFANVVRRLGSNGIAVGSHGEVAGSSIRAVGPVRESSLLASYYSAADALIVPSLSDNYPNTVIEAQCCGTPVFAYRTGGMPEQMPPFWSGVVEPRDIAGLVKLIDDYLRKGGKTPGLSKQLEENAVATWNLGSAAVRYREVYRRALGRKIAGNLLPGRGVVA
jgi:putative colanic acid biosynthesis glycosyltransferase